MKSPQKLFYTVGLGLLLSTTTLLANPLTAQEIAKKAYSTLDSHQSYAFDAVIVNHSDEKNNRHDVSVKVNRPGQFRIDLTGETRNRSNYLNDGQYTVYDHDKNIYLYLDTDKDINNALDDLFDRLEIKAPLAQLIYSDMGKRMKFNSSKNFGIVDLEGVECHYIAFSDKVKEVHVWITTGDTPLLKHYIIKDKTSKSNAYKATTIHWKEAKSISPSDFLFTVPKNAKEVFIK